MHSRPWASTDHSRRLLAALVILATTASAAAAPDRAEPRPPADVARDIDRAIDARLAAAGVRASPPADDAEFARRVHLDLIGRVATPERAAAFIDGTAPDKRATLVDELLADPEYAKHFANVWHDLIVARTPLNARIKPEPLRAAFAEAFASGLSWGGVVGRVIDCRDGTPERNFLAFYRINGDMGGVPMANVAARSASRPFLGRQMQCAECHDDPEKPWTQEEYWGLAAFFGRVSVAEKTDKTEPATIVERTGYKSPKGSSFKLTVRADGALAVHMEARDDVGRPMKPRLPVGGDPMAFGAADPILPELVRWISAPDNPLVARAAVNRWWAHFFARGLAHPVDDLRDDNPASHPEVLQLLANEFARSGQDLRHLIRCLCASRAYQRSSRPADGNATAPAELFARMPLKPMTAEVLLDSLAVAYDVPDLYPRVTPPAGKRAPPAFTRRHFVELFNTNDPVEGDPTDYLLGIPQVLHLMNVPQYNTGGNRVAKLAGGGDPAAAVEALYLATLSRRPTAAELKRKLDLAARHATPRDGLSGVLWTLVNGNEFLLNH